MFNQLFVHLQVQLPDSVFIDSTETSFVEKYVTQMLSWKLKLSCATLWCCLPSGG